MKVSSLCGDMDRPLTSRNTQPETQRVTVNAPPQTLNGIKNQNNHNSNFNSNSIVHLNGNKPNKANNNSNHVKPRSHLTSQYNVSSKFPLPLKK